MLESNRSPALVGGTLLRGIHHASAGRIRGMG